MSDELVWALFGSRVGDNRQIEALAGAIGLPWTAKRLRFRPSPGLRNFSRAGSLASLTDETRTLLAPPWPDVVIAAGKRAAPVALWVKAASGGATRLVHVGRPWSPLDWFDLVVTTPQYRLPARPNVILNALPLTAPGPAGAEAVRPDLDALPRPRLLALAGGDSPPLAFDAATARAFALEALARVQKAGGSLLVATSPRTSPEALGAIRAALAGADVAVRLSAFGEAPNDYRAFLCAADGLLVTADSAAMLTEAAMTGAPVAPFALPERPDPWRRAVGAFGQLTAFAPLTRTLLDKLIDLGLVTSVRDLGRFAAHAKAEGLLAGGPAARERASRELGETAARVLKMSRNI